MGLPCSRRTRPRANNSTASGTNLAIERRAFGVPQSRHEEQAPCDALLRRLRAREALPGILQQPQLKRLWYPLALSSAPLLFACRAVLPCTGSCSPPFSLAPTRWPSARPERPPRAPATARPLDLLLRRPRGGPSPGWLQAVGALAGRALSLSPAMAAGVR